MEERGLKNIPTTADALPVLLSEDIQGLFERTGVLSPKEVTSRYEVYAEQYILSIEVEAKLVVDMATTMIYPAAVNYLSTLTETLSAAKALSITLDSGVATRIATTANASAAAVTDAALAAAAAADAAAAPTAPTAVVASAAAGKALGRVDEGEAARRSRRVALELSRPARHNAQTALRNSAAHHLPHTAG